MPASGSKRLPSVHLQGSRQQPEDADGLPAAPARPCSEHVQLQRSLLGEVPEAEQKQGDGLRLRLQQAGRPDALEEHAAGDTVGALHGWHPLDHSNHSPQQLLGLHQHTSEAARVVGQARPLPENVAGKAFLRCHAAHPEHRSQLQTHQSEGRVGHGEVGGDVQALARFRQR